MPASRRGLHSGSSSPRARPSQNGILFPLDAVYARAGVRPPAVKAIAPDDIPAPYRSLLVHTNDMTLTLERHFGGRVSLRPLSTFLDRRWYFRRWFGSRLVRRHHRIMVHLSGRRRRQVGRRGPCWRQQLFLR